METILHVNLKGFYLLPDLFAIGSDERSGGDALFVAMFATVLLSYFSRYDSALQTVPPMGDENSLRVDDLPST